MKKRQQKRAETGRLKTSTENNERCVETFKCSISQKIHTHTDRHTDISRHTHTYYVFLYTHKAHVFQHDIIDSLCVSSFDFVIFIN